MREFLLPAGGRQENGYQTGVDLFEPCLGVGAFPWGGTVLSMGAE